ncbi:unnamed protein product [Cuscuta campestris]|uniref:Replication protein A OB domain-containing protein n=1 Tax=Cuscuta campestris TaxID=132261 RepID=A0A484MMV8_9ASTE|nr:unnamed protein product [Cuscuta campestris]
MAIVILRIPREYVSVPGHAKTTHDFMLVNEEMKPVVLTLWEDFTMNQGRDITSLLESGRHPIILGKRVTVTPFNGRAEPATIWKIILQVRVNLQDLGTSFLR